MCGNSGEKNRAKWRKMIKLPIDLAIGGTVMAMDAMDRALLALLKANSREPITMLARKLGLSRSTVRDRMAGLERRGIIGGYTVTVPGNYEATRVRAHVMLSVDPKRMDGVVVDLRKNPALEALYAVSGAYDLIAIVGAESTGEMDALLDRMGKLAGVDRTVSSIVLSTKFDRS